MTCFRYRSWKSREHNMASHLTRISKGGENEMDRIRCLFKKWVPAEEYGRTVNPGAAHHAAQQFLKSHEYCLCLSAQHVSTDIYWYHWRKVCVLYVNLLHTILRTLSLSNETTTTSKQWLSPVFLLHVCSAMPSQTKVMQRTRNEATVECQTIHSCHAESTQSNANYMKWGADRMSDGVVCQSNEQSKEWNQQAGRDKWWGHQTSKRWKE